MTDHSDSRSLLLERLESRCMLAAGLFAYSVDHHGDSDRLFGDAQKHASDGRQGAEFLRVGEARNQVLRFAYDQHRGRQDHGGRPDQNSPPPSLELQGSGRTNSIDNIFNLQETTLLTPVVQSANASTSIPPASAVPELGPGRGLPDANVGGGVQLIATRNDTSQSNTIRNEASVGSVDSTAISRTEVLSAISAPIESNPSVSTSDQVVDVAAGLNPIDEAREALDFDTETFDDVDRFIDDATIDFASDSNSRWDGLIEPQLGLRSEWLRQESSSDEATWEIRGQTLKQLRDLAADPSVEQVGQSNRLTDQVIATWFEGAGGLVEIESVNTPLVGGSNLPIYSGDVVGIVLDATLGLHRSVNLISGELVSKDQSDQTVGDGEAVRDAVLAAIAGEASSPVSPIGVEARPKLSSIAYPGAVILASALAIIGRRKTVRLFNSKDRKKKS